VDPEASAALARRRRDLADEKRRWGDAVFGMLRAELFASPSALSRVPVSGFLVMAIAPVLMVLAAVSPRCRLRCIEYIDAQIVLIEERLRLAVVARRPGHAAGIAQLQAFARTNRALRAALEHAPPRASARTAADGRETEAWMGLAGPMS